MKKLSREEMKNVMGGNLPKQDTYKCCVGSSTTDCGDCNPHPNCLVTATQVKC